MCDIYYAGIDPGRFGALCVLDDKGRIDDVYDLPYKKNRLVFAGLADIFEMYPNMHLAVEHQHSRPTDSKKAVWTNAFNYRAIFDVVAAVNRYSNCNITTRLCTPGEWHAHFNIEPYKDRASRKQAVKDIVLRHYPDAPLWGKLGGFRDGRSDAI